MKKEQVVSQAEFARQMGLHRSQISRLVKRGLPVRDDGQLDQGAAQAWCEQNHSSKGWRGARGDRRKEKAQKPKSAATGSLVRLDVDHFPSIAKLLLLMTSPENTALVAGMALRAGCAPREAYRVALFVRVWISVIYGPEGEPLSWMSEPEDPDWVAVFRELGATVTAKQLARWDAELAREVAQAIA